MADHNHVYELMSLPREILSHIADFCSIDDHSLLNFSLSSRMTYREIYSQHFNLFSTRIERAIYYELKRNELLSSAKYKRDRSDSKQEENSFGRKKRKDDNHKEKETVGEKLMNQFRDINNFVKKTNDFIQAQEDVKNQLFQKWDKFLDNFKLAKVPNAKQLVQDEIFSKFVLQSTNQVVAGDFRKNFYEEGKIGKSSFYFEAYDEEDGGKSTQWSIILDHESLCSFSSDECFLYKKVAKKFLQQCNLKSLSPIDLVDILLRLQPWFFESTFQTFKQNVEIE